MYKISEDKISEQTLQLNTEDYPVSQYKWLIEMDYKDGGIMKKWSLGADGNPINKVSFSLGEKGCIDATLKFSQIDFPVYYGNEILISYNGRKRYRGFINNIPSYTSPDSLKCTPFTNKLNTIFINTTFTNNTFKEMIFEVLNDKSTSLGIFYNESMMTDYTDVTVYSGVKYNYTPCQQVIDDYYERTDDVYWGVEANGFLYLKKRSTSISKSLYSGGCQAFQSLTYKKDWTKIKATRYHIFQKSTATGENIFIATIPDGSSNYPYSDMELTVGTLEQKLTAPSGLNSTECKDYAYGKIFASRAPDNVKVKGIDINKIDLSIGDKVRIYTGSQLQLKELISCDSTAKWYGEVSLEDNIKVEGDYSLSFPSYATIIYDFGELQKYDNIKKISFMLKSDKQGTYLQASFGKKRTGYSQGIYSNDAYSANVLSTACDLFCSNQSISIRNIATWNLIELNVTNDFRYFAISRLSTGYTDATLYIDDIRLYAFQNRFYDANVIKLDYDLDKENLTLYDAELGEFNPFLNDLLFTMEKRVRDVEVSQQE